MLRPAPREMPNKLVPAARTEQCSILLLASVNAHSHRGCAELAKETQEIAENGCRNPATVLNKGLPTCQRPAAKISN